MKTLINRSGFTLAEVLITLGVIGVVAALTIPTLSQNATDREIVSRTKKVYATLVNAYKLAEQENGTPDKWGMTGANDTSDEILINTLKPYLQVSIDCSVTGTKGCYKANQMYKYLNGGNMSVLDDGGKSLLLADGTSMSAGCIWSRCVSGSMGSTTALKNVCGVIRADVNGFKGPNIQGKDFFQFWLTKYGVIPMGSQAETGSPFIGYCLNSSGTFNTGQSCVAWVLYNENLDYMKCPVSLKNGWNGPSTCG